jgi:PKD repeat protein
MNNQVVHLAEDGAGLWRGGAFAFPRSVCVDTKDGSCWVADTLNNQVVHLAEDGTELWRGGSFNQPYAVSVNAMDGSCWVADTGNDQVIHLVVTEGPPRARFTAAPLAGTAPLQVTFTDESLRNPTTWSWDFGDGGTSDEQHPSHEYVDLGVYEVTLTASNAYGSDSETDPLYIKVLFSDLAADHWACDEILSCAGAGIVSGYDDGSYQPDRPVDRAQMAVYISRALAGSDSGVPEPVTDPGFTDVAPDHWAYKYICYAVDQSIVEGYPEGDYKPERAVDRGQMAVYIARAVAGGDSSVPDLGCTEPVFPDVQCDFWARKYIQYTRETGVTGGYDDGLYHPERIVTRDQMAVYVARASGLLD